MKKNFTVIIAICGKSAVGKDSLAKFIYQDFKNRRIPVHRIISDTTRPKRQSEKDGIDYHFLSQAEFLNKAQNKGYLEYTQFRGWHYGTPLSEVEEFKINIGVFSPSGMKSLVKFADRFIIIPFYLESSLRSRLINSYDREKKWKIEYFRRALVDWFDFRNIKYILNNMYKNGYYYVRAENSIVLSSIRYLNDIINKLERGQIDK